jgi:hypothetical protein
MPWVNQDPHWYPGKNPKFYLNYFKYSKFPLVSNVSFLHICDVKILTIFFPKIAKFVKITLEKHIYSKFLRLFLSKQKKKFAPNFFFKSLLIRLNQGRWVQTYIVTPQCIT